MIAHPLFETFGARLEYWRKLRGYKRQGAFAEAVKIKQGSLSELESGKSKQPAADVLLRMCDLLQIRPKYLLFGEGPAESQYFQELSGTEAQLVMMFRALPNDAMRDAALIDINDRLRRPVLAPQPPQTTMPIAPSAYVMGPAKVSHAPSKKARPPKRRSK